MYHVKNTTKFGKDIKNVWMVEEEIMIPHDIVNLFTSVPVSAAMDVIGERLVKDKTFKGK